MTLWKAYCFSLQLPLPLFLLKPELLLKKHPSNLDVQRSLVMPLVLANNRMRKKLMLMTMMMNFKMMMMVAMMTVLVTIVVGLVNNINSNVL